MAQPLIPVPRECDSILMILPSSRLLRAIVSSLKSDFFPIWREIVSFVVLEEVPAELLGSADKFEWLLSAVRSATKGAMKKIVLHPDKNGLSDWAYAVTRSTEFENIVSTQIRYLGADGAHRHISAHLRRWSYESIDLALKEAVWKQTYSLKDWINQWIDLDLENLGCAVARSVQFVSSKTIVERLCLEALDDPPSSAMLPCYVIVFERPYVDPIAKPKEKVINTGQLADHDSNVLLSKALVASLDSYFGSRCFYLELEMNDINFSKEYGTKTGNRDYSAIDWSRVGTLVMIDEVNFSGHKAYAKEKGSKSQLQRMQKIASAKALPYSLRFAYSTKIGFEYAANPKWDQNFTSAYFKGIEVGQGANPLFQTSQSAPMAFEFVSSPSDRAAGQVVGECLSPGTPLGQGGMASTIFFATVTSANTDPPLLKAGKPVTYNGMSVAKWKALIQDRRP